jgi:ring-1,2-phenylacetyl-CoA epoxidase subunit PaaE
MSSFHSLTVSHIERETRDSVVLTFFVPPEMQSAFAFKQGQYLTLRATIDGAEVRRAYSICSAEDSALRVGIKHRLMAHFQALHTRKSNLATPLT